MAAATALTSMGSPAGMDDWGSERPSPFLQQQQQLPTQPRVPRARRGVAAARPGEEESAQLLELWAKDYAKQQVRSKRLVTEPQLPEWSTDSFPQPFNRHSITLESGSPTSPLRSREVPVHLASLVDGIPPMLPAPVGERRARRASYSIGYGALGTAPTSRAMTGGLQLTGRSPLLSHEPDSLWSPTAGANVLNSTRKLPPATYLGLDNSAQFSYEDSTTLGGLSRMPTASNAGEGADSQSGGLLKRMGKRIIKRAKTKSQLIVRGPIESDKERQREPAAAKSGAIFVVPDSDKAAEDQAQYVDPYGIPDKIANARISAAPEIWNLFQADMQHAPAEFVDDQYTNSLSLAGSASGIQPSTATDLRHMVHAHSIRRGMRKESKAILLTLVPFIPRTLVAEVVQDDAKYAAFDNSNLENLVVANHSLRPSMVEVQGAVMIADVKGFTALTEILSKKGTGGVELLTTCMNSYFTQVINVILAYDGDVIKFAGDSMIVLFRPRLTESSSLDEERRLKEAASRCACCAHMLAENLGHMRMKMNGQAEPIGKPGQDGVEGEEPPDAAAASGSELMKRAGTLARRRGNAPGPSPSPGAMDERNLTAFHHAAQHVTTSRLQSNGNISNNGSMSESGTGGQPSRQTSVPGLAIVPDTPVLPSNMTLHMNPLDSCGIDDDESRHSYSHMEFATPNSAGPGTPASQRGGSFSKKPRKNSSWFNVTKKAGQGSKKLHMEESGSVISVNNTGITSSRPSVTVEGRTGSGSSPASTGFMNLRKKGKARNSEIPAPNRVSSLIEDGLLAGGAMLPREMSFASKLNIPPPVRNMPNASNNTALSALAAYQPAVQRPPMGSAVHPQDRVENLEDKIRNSEFSLKIMVGAGSIAIFRVGGEVDELSKDLPEVPRWEYFIADRPLAPSCDHNGRRRPIAQVAAIEDQAEAGQVVASHEMVELLEDEWDILPLKDNVSRILTPKQPFTELKHPAPLFRNRRVGSTVIAAHPLSGNTWQESPDILEAVKLASITSVALPEQLFENASPDLSPECVNVAQELSSLEDHVQQRLLNVNRMHLLGSVRPHIEETYLDSVSENRSLTCLFIGFPTLLAETSNMSQADQLSAVQFCMQQLQRVMAHYNGSLLQFRCDEKGYVAICAFGLPGHTHEDNPGRGIVAALELQKVINDARHRVVIGVTTGELLCTCVGARKLRLEYTVFGDAINLSARLMVKCKKGSTNILCDELTFQSPSARYRAHYNQLEPLAVKGKEKRVQVYEVIPRGAGDALESNNASLAMSEGVIVGRENELNYIINRAVPLMTNLHNGGESTVNGGTILLEGITGMGKTMLLNEARKWLDMIEKQYQQRASQTGILFNVFYGIADVSNKNSKLYAWRRIFQELFALDRSRSHGDQNADARGTGNARGSSGSADHQIITALGTKLVSHFPQYNEEWRKQIAEWLELPITQIPQGGECTELAATSSMDTATMQAPGFQVGVHGSATGGPHALGIHMPATASGRMSSMPRTSSGAEPHMSSSGIQGNTGAHVGRGRAGARNSKQAGANSLSQAAIMLAASNSALRSTPGMSSYTPTASTAQYLTALIPQDSTQFPLFDTPLDASAATQLMPTRSSSEMPAAALGDTTGMQYPMRGVFDTTAQTNSGHHRAVGLSTGTNSAAGTPRGAGRGAANIIRPPAEAANRNLDPIQVLFEVFRMFTKCYGNAILLIENLHEFDTPSWKLLNKIVDKQRSQVLVVATSRPSNDSSESAVGGSRPGAGRVHAMYRQLLNMSSTKLLPLGPFNFQQTKTLMTQVGNKSFPDQFVLAVMEKTGGMPHYIEKITEFLSQKQWVDDEGNEIMNVNKAIRTLNFKQVILHRLDKLPVSVHLTLKVASIMGQWVDLDILHKFYPPRVPITKEQLAYNLTELEHSKFLKATDTYGVWEFNMVERDSVYEVLPTKTKRMLHARLAAELERSSEEDGEQHVATLTTIAYHWNQACLDYETTKHYRALKAIEYWAKAAEAGYSVTSLQEALRLFKKAAYIAGLLHNAFGSQHYDDKSQHEGSVQSDHSSESFLYQADDSYDLPSDGIEHHRNDSRGHGLYSTNDVPPPRTDDDDDSDAEEFNASGKRRHLKWSLISNRSRAQWEKWIASCCLGIIMQQQVDLSAQVELHDSEDYFQLLVSHATEGLRLLGTPDLQSLMKPHAKPDGLMALFSCCMPKPEPLMGWKEGVVLQEQDVSEIKDLLLVLILAVDNCKIQLDSSSCIHILRVCKRICYYFRKCCVGEQDPLAEVEQICRTRLRAHRSRKQFPIREQYEEIHDFASDSK